PGRNRRAGVSRTMGSSRLCFDAGYWRVAKVEHRYRSFLYRTDRPGRLSADELLREMVREAGGTTRQDGYGIAAGGGERRTGARLAKIDASAARGTRAD